MAPSLLHIFLILAQPIILVASSVHGFRHGVGSKHDGSQDLSKQLQEICCHLEDRVALQEARTLLQRGANPNLVDAGHFFCSPLFHAVQRNLVNTTLLLIRHQANTNQPNRLGFRPLHIAAVYGSVESILLLLRAGADINAKTVFGFDAYNMAVQYGNLHAGLVLLELMTFDQTALKEYREKGVDLKLEWSVLYRSATGACSERHALAFMKPLLRSDTVGLVLPLNVLHVAELQSLIPYPFHPNGKVSHPRDFERYLEHSSNCSETESTELNDSTMEGNHQEELKAAEPVVLSDHELVKQYVNKRSSLLPPKRKREGVRTHKIKLTRRSEYGIEHGDTVIEYDAVSESTSDSDKLMNFVRKEANDADKDMSSSAENQYMFELLTGKEEARRLEAIAEEYVESIKSVF